MEPRLLSIEYVFWDENVIVRNIDNMPRVITKIYP